MASRRMQSAASTLGVIAIVSVMIIATASETRNGVDRFTEKKGSHHIAAVEGSTKKSVIEALSSETRISRADDDTVASVTIPNEINSNSSTNIIIHVGKFEVDQSDVELSQVVENDPQGDRVHANGYPVAEQRTSNSHSVAEEDWTSRGTPTETTSIAVLEVLTLRETLIENRNQNVEQSAPTSKATDGPSPEKNAPGTLAMIDREVALETDALRTDKQNLTESLYESEPMPDSPAVLAVDSTRVKVNSNEETTRGTVPTSIERKDIENAWAVSFQVPSAVVADGENPPQHGNQRKDDAGKIEQNRKSIETRKDHSRPANNLLVSGKSTKAFYEIKPSIKTEMDKGHDQPVTTTHAGWRFVLPSVDSAFGKFGPYFEDGEQEVNVTARIGSTVLLDCKIGMLGDKKVTWVQHVKDSFRLLTVGKTPYSVDQRIGLNFRYPSNWRLQILYATPRDSGLYQCQVATHPPLVKKINVIVTVPALKITDDSGRIVAKERHLKAGSALSLRCEARDVLESQNESVVWTRGDETLTKDVSENRTTEISATGKEDLVIISTLIVERANASHAGNYSCMVAGKAKTTIAVHVLNGELPAAVHDGSGVSRAVLNLWLIHLTVSYVFSR